MTPTTAIPESAVRPAHDPTELVPGNAEFEARWAAWQARGVAHDRAVRRRFQVLAPVLAIAAAIVYGLLLR